VALPAVLLLSAAAARLLLTAGLPAVQQSIGSKPTATACGGRVGQTQAHTSLC